MNMNSSSSNSNNGFSSFDGTNSVLGFNSPPLTASRKPSTGVGANSGSNVSRSRITKARKQAIYHNHNHNDHKSVNVNPLDTTVAGDDRGLGFSDFNRSRSSPESVFGNMTSGAREGTNWGLDTGVSVSSVDSKSNDVILDDMLKLNSNRDKVYANASENNSASTTDELHDELQNELANEINDLQIDGNVELDLENETKMNPKDPAETSFESNLNFRTYEKMAEFAFTSKLDDISTPNVEFRAPDTRNNMFSGVNRLGSRKGHVKETRSKKKKGKLKTPIVGRSRVREDFIFIRRNSFDDFEKLAVNYSRESSVTSDASQTSESRIITSNVTTDDEACEPQINEVSETESFKSATENLEYNYDTLGTSLDPDESSTATSARQESGATEVFSFGSRSENINNSNFTFAASSSGQSQLPSDTRQHRTKLPLQIVREPYSSTKAELFPIDLPTLSSTRKDNLKFVNEQDFRHESVPGLSSSKVAEEACEKWRLRGNQAYSVGDLAKAEDWYTQGINSVSENEKSGSCLKALMLCYSNRAATRISMGRMKEALGDCLMAATIDPDFLKVQVRAAHCYLAMGEIENAKKHYTKCLQSGKDNSADRKVIAEASEGLEKTQKVLDCIEQCTLLLQRQSSEDLECALRLINDALKISACLEKLLQMKADSFFMLRRYEEVVQTLTSNEADASTTSSSGQWRSHLIVKSYFYLGRLDEALEFIKKQENSIRLTPRVDNTSQESAIPLADTIRELLSHKTAGNEAFKSGKHSEAVEHYTAALSCYSGSRPFASVCYCNRAAAHKALGQIPDAIADCSVAIALDPNYLKAISRRASLYELIRDYGQAERDLQRLVSILKTQLEKSAISGASDKLNTVNELKQTQIQLSKVEAESRKGIPLNAYLILGVVSTASAADIRKAYRKAALKHHPDKAAQSLGRGDDGDDGVWREIAENVHKDADRLFKMIGEAYAVLSNPSKRLKYDQDEEKRNESNKFTRSNSSRMDADAKKSVFEQSGNRSQQQDSRRTYVRTHSTGSENSGSSYRYSN